VERRDRRAPGRLARHPGRCERVAQHAVVGEEIGERHALARDHPPDLLGHLPRRHRSPYAVAQARVADLTDLVRAGAASDDPGAALDAFLARIAQEARAKRDVPDVLGGSPMPALAAFHAALDDLLAAAREAGALRPGIGTAELVALLKGLLHAVSASDDPELPARLLSVVRDGLLPPRADTDPPFD